MTKRKHTVRDLMSTSVIFLRETDHLSQALREMTLAAVRHLPIVDEHRKLVGLVSSHDLVAAVEREGDGALASLMSREVTTVTPDAPAADAVGLMIDQKFNCLPVVSKTGELVGILTATDFLVVAQQALNGAPIERLPTEV